MFLCSSFWSQNNHSFPGSCRAAATASHILRERTHFNVSSNARATLFFFFTHFLHSLARNSRSLHLTELILIRGCPVSYSATAPLISVEFCWFTHNQIHCSVNSYYCSQSLTDERMIPSHGKKIKIKTNQIQRIQKKMLTLNNAQCSAQETRYCLNIVRYFTSKKKKNTDLGQTFFF